MVWEERAPTGDEWAVDGLADAIAAKSCEYY